MAWREVDGFESRIDSMKWPQGQDSVLWDNIAGDDNMELVREESSGRTMNLILEVQFCGICRSLEGWLNKCAGHLGGKVWAFKVDRSPQLEVGSPSNQGHQWDAVGGKNTHWGEPNAEPRKSA